MIDSHQAASNGWTRSNLVRACARFCQPGPHILPGSAHDPRMEHPTTLGGGRATIERVTVTRSGKQASHILLLGAAAAALVHGAFSMYWALGGRWMLDTVGPWAIDLADRAPVAAGAVLLVTAGVKVGGGVCPLLHEAGRLPGSTRTWRRVFLGGALLLIGYGGLNTIGAWIGIAIDHTLSAPRLGHAALWDPLFLLWGVLLLLGMRPARRSSAV